MWVGVERNDAGQCGLIGDEARAHEISNIGAEVPGNLQQETQSVTDARRNHLFSEAVALEPCSDHLFVEGLAEGIKSFGGVWINR